MVWQAMPSAAGAGGYRDTLGNAWEPFAFNSGMSRIAVPRHECLALGILRPEQRIEPDRSININEGLEASAAKFDAALQDQLAKTPGLRLLDGVLTLIENDGRRRLVGRLERWREAYSNANANHDSLGRFATAGGALSERDNIRRGSCAIERALRTRRDVRAAMMVKGLGTVHFKWGRPGTKAKNAQGASHSDGYGISHIQAKRGAAAVRALPEVLAKGRVLPHPDTAEKRVIKWNGWTAIAEKTNQTNSYVVTHIDDDVHLKNRGRLPQGSAGQGRRWEPGCGPCPTQPALLFGKGPLVASNADSFAQTRLRLKQLLWEAA